jgi:crossover junction endodeoxyribonuclease RusA
MRLHQLPGGKTAARYPPAVYQWRGQVQQAVAETMMTEGLEPFLGAVELKVGFDLPRPLSHHGTGRNAATVKPSAPPFPITAPDLDKLVRCVQDAITDAGLWKDDSQVCSLVTAKRYAAHPGVHIVVTALDPC